MSKQAGTGGPGAGSGAGDGAADALDQLAELVGCCAPLAREPLSGKGALELARVFKALGDPVRLRLLSLIASHAGGEACVCDLTDVFDLAGPTISHHLKVLREAGLITGQRRGTWVYYRVRPELLARLSEVLLPADTATSTNTTTSDTSTTTATATATAGDTLAVGAGAPA